MSRMPKTVPTWLNTYFRFVGERDNEFDSTTTMNLVYMYWEPFREYYMLTRVENPKSSKKSSENSKKRKKTSKTKGDDEEDSRFADYLGDSYNPEEDLNSPLNQSVDIDISSYISEDSGVDINIDQPDMPVINVDEEKTNLINEKMGEYIEKEFDNIENINFHVEMLQTFIKEYQNDLTIENLISINNHLFILINKLLDKTD